LAFLPSTRRKFIGLAATAGVGALALDSALLEPNFPHVVRRQIALRRWPERLNGFTIVLLSDFHYDPYFSVHPLHAAIPMVNQLRPDLIALGGDFVSLSLMPYNGEKDAAAAAPCAELLRQLHAPHGLWAVLGNHDFFSAPHLVIAALQGQGIRVLLNESVPIEQNGVRFWLAGVHDVLSGTADLGAALHAIPGGEATILLAHEPDYADYVARHPVDLQLSGHSHGGQVRIPLVGPLYLPALAQKYILGLYEVGPLTLYTNAGLGTIRLPVRFNCPPEITLLTINRSAA
jgi:uncharacterized protein